MIKLQVIGNLGKDCVVNTVNGKNVINFSVAHTEKFRDASGNQKDRTIWVECAYWTDRTAIAPYLKKGTTVYAEGNPEVRTYQTNDGRSGASLTMRVISIQLLGGSRNENEGGGGGGYQQQSGNSGGNYNNNSGGGGYNNNNNSGSQQGGGYSSQGAPNDMTEPVDDLPF